MPRSRKLHLDTLAIAFLLACCMFWGFQQVLVKATVAEVEAVHADNLRAHRLGINGVPCFVVAGRHAIAGAQEPEVLERLLDVALVEG